MHVIFQKKRQKNVKKEQNIWKFGQKCTRFENTLKKGRWLRATIARNNLLEKALLPSGLFSIQQMIVTLLEDKISVYMLIIMYMLNGQRIMKRFLCSLILFQSLVEAKLLYKKDFDFSFNLIYPSLFCWFLQLLLAMIRI